MSGGFFRGTSAEQDTRFSNKQTKLMKSQKFAPELEHLVDMTKVKMDIMKPWIAKRVTELIGFEDEVLINFIYGLLEGKVVNGKEIQIQLTGFMERNTGKFMKELWVLLLSAQNNASGVPQQFLEAKEEEMRKKKAETDRITNEIQRKKERENRERELDQEKRKQMDGWRDKNAAALESSPKHQRSTNGLDPVEKDGARGRSRVSRSPRSVDHSPSPRRSRSVCKSLSNSRSYSGERRRPRNTSGSPGEHSGRPVSSERAYRSPMRRSVSPRRKHSPRRSLSPPRHRRRSASRVRRWSPSPARYWRHSPFRRRSRSPIRRRSRSPIRHRLRSPMWRRSRSPSRRSPVRYRSRSPTRRGSPPSIRCRTPSPAKHRSSSPMSRGYCRSPLSPQRSSPSPVQRKSSISGRKRTLTIARRSMTPVRKSLSPQESLSPSPICRRSPSPIKKRISMNVRSPVQSPRKSIRRHKKYSPVRHASPDKAESHKGSRPSERRSAISSRSPQRDIYDSKDLQRKESPLPPPPHRSPSVSESPRHSRSESESPPAKRDKSPTEDRGPRSSLNRRERKTIDTDSPYRRKSREYRVRSNICEKIPEEKEKNSSREAFEHKPRSSRKVPTTADPYKDLGEGRDEVEFSEIHSHSDRLELRKRTEVIKSENLCGRMEQSKELNRQKSPSTHRHFCSGKREKESYDGESFKPGKDLLSYANNTKGKELNVESETSLANSRKVEQNDRSGNEDSGSEESKKCKAEVKEKRKHKRSSRYESSSDDSCDSDVEDRKDAKRRRKEERRLKKEERRRRREERRRRKEERRAQKLKLKSANAMSSPSATERNPDGSDSDDEHVRKEDRTDSESLQKRLEIELREKALKSLRAKKGISH